MKHIFISHAGPDGEIAKRLDEDLKNAGHEVVVDLRVVSDPDGSHGLDFPSRVFLFIDKTRGG